MLSNANVPTLIYDTGGILTPPAIGAAPAAGAAIGAAPAAGSMAVQAGGAFVGYEAGSNLASSLGANQNFSVAAGAAGAYAGAAAAPAIWDAIAAFFAL